MKSEFRAHIAEVRSSEIDGKPGITLRAVKPGVVDDYRSLWTPDVFDKSLEQRLPVLCWGHDWSNPLGPAVGFRATPDGPEVDFLFSDFDAVPDAKRAYAQVKDGTIVDCSVGFSRVDGGTREPTEEEKRDYPGVGEVITQAGLEEVSLVIRGAVPGAKVLAVRSPSGAIVELSEDFVVDLARKVAAGDLTRAEADIALELAGGKPKPTPDPTVDAKAAVEAVTEAERLLGEFD